MTICNLNRYMFELSRKSDFDLKKKENKQQTLEIDDEHSQTNKQIETKQIILHRRCIQLYLRRIIIKRTKQNLWNEIEYVNRRTHITPRPHFFPRPAKATSMIAIIQTSRNV